MRPRRRDFVQTQGLALWVGRLSPADEHVRLRGDACANAADALERVVAMTIPDVPPEVLTSLITAAAAIVSGLLVYLNGRGRVKAEIKETTAAAVTAERDARARVYLRYLHALDGLRFDVAPGAGTWAKWFPAFQQCDNELELVASMNVLEAAYRFYEELASLAEDAVIPNQPLVRRIRARLVPGYRSIGPDDSTLRILYEERRSSFDRWRQELINEMRTDLSHLHAPAIAAVTPRPRPFRWVQRPPEPETPKE